MLKGMTTQGVFKTAILVCGLSLLSSLGCAAAHQGIPTGQWTGQGSYVDYEAVNKGKDEDVVQDRARQGSYETSLEISQQQVYGRESLVFDIRSQRGKLMNVDGTESHLRFILVPLEKLEQGAQLYACRDWEYNPDKERRLSEGEFDEKRQFASASCMQRGGATVLQINYAFPTADSPPSFADTIVFKGDRVYKTGQFIKADTIKQKNKPNEEKLITVYWAETLRKH